MPKSWSMVDSNFPTFTGNEKPAEQIRALVDYMFVLVEELKYQLENLDSNNWNSMALQNFQTDTTADVSEQVAAIAANLSLVTSEVAAISNRLSAVEGLPGRMNELESDVSYMEAAVEQLRQVTQELTEQTSALQEFADETQQILRVDEESGAVIVGRDGSDLRFVGNIDFDIDVGTVKTVNGIEADENGNVAIDTQDISDADILNLMSAMQ